MGLLYAKVFAILNFYTFCSSDLPHQPHTHYYISLEFQSGIDCYKSLGVFFILSGPAKDKIQSYEILMNSCGVQIPSKTPNLGTEESEPVSYSEGRLMKIKSPDKKEAIEIKNYLQTSPVGNALSEAIVLQIFNDLVKQNRFIHLEITDVNKGDNKPSYIMYVFSLHKLQTNSINIMCKYTEGISFEMLDVSPDEPGTNIDVDVKFGRINNIWKGYYKRIRFKFVNGTSHKQGCQVLQLKKDRMFRVRLLLLIICCVFSTLLLVLGGILYLMNIKIIVCNEENNEN